MDRICASMLVLEWEPREAHALEWMPLAVRYKLDVLGLSMRLAAWKSLVLNARRALVQLPATTDEEWIECLAAFSAAGARREPSRRHEWRSFDAYLDARAAPLTRNI